MPQERVKKVGIEREGKGGEKIAVEMRGDQTRCREKTSAKKSAVFSSIDKGEESRGGGEKSRYFFPSNRELIAERETLGAGRGLPTSATTEGEKKTKGGEKREGRGGGAVSKSRADA